MSPIDLRPSDLPSTKLNEEIPFGELPEKTACPLAQIIGS